MRSPALTALAAVLLLALGCATPESVQRRSSLTAYLGGKDAAPLTASAVASLPLPVPPTSPPHAPVAPPPGGALTMTGTSSPAGTSAPPKPRTRE